jgi:hypothetical protein
MNINHHDETRNIAVFESNKLIRFIFTAVFFAAVFIVPPVVTIQFFMV